ncbi:NYN domain-containing protein [Terriglobus sp. RCC_193]|uniref:NYN domain-containing protein n=1 Tax=Terriglobus sp. RCC_193 TaxID=3239218 RepID=UPI003523EB57
MFTSRYAVFVDAGYIFGQGALSFSAGKLTRSQLRLNEAEIINQLKSITTKPVAELLRIYWYDGTRGNMTIEQTTLAEMPDVKMRLGYINGAGQQKGVDSLIVTDLIELARNQAIGDAYLVSGDGDLRVAVQIAQSFGVRVHLITLEPSNSSLNPQLRQEADTRHEIPKTEVIKFLRMEQLQGTVLSIAATAEVSTQLVSTPGFVSATMQATPAKADLSLKDAATQAIKSVFSAVTPEEIAKLKALQTGKVIPPEYDRKILGTARALLGRDLTNPERATMRKLVLAWLRQT